MTQTTEKPQADKNPQKAIPRQPRFEPRYIGRVEKIAELALKLVFSREAKKEHNGDLDHIKTSRWNSAPDPKSPELEINLYHFLEKDWLSVTYKQGPLLNFTIKDGKITSVDSRGNSDDLLKRLIVEASGLDFREIQSMMRCVPKPDHPPIKIPVDPTQFR
jgi:hypothetical protein